MLEALAIRHAAHVSGVVREGANSPLVKNNIACSWVRCMDHYGIDPAQPHHSLVIEHSQLLEHRQKLDGLLETASVEMNNLYQQISGSGFAILLTDSEGVIISGVSDPPLVELYNGAGLRMGALWSEEHEGTNAIGTCLIEKQPLIVHRDEHYRIRNIQLTCSASPIFDPYSNLLGVLDASSVSSQDSRQSQFHTLALTTLAAKLIENCCFLKHFQNACVLYFNTRPEYVSLPSSGMLAFDGEGHILAANRSALHQLACQNHRQLIDQIISDIFDIKMDYLMGWACYQASTVWPTHDRHGKRYFAMVRGPERYAHTDSATPRSSGRDVLTDRSLGIVEPAPAPLSMILEGLQGSDPIMIHNVRCARRVMNKNISILLNGETGTGKEAFAKAIHAASNRAALPFVAVNCASIPENLIESELFGYRHGAFTGARREGLRGKILQASGGTLFLDEIGDMPPQLQTRLLRVLEEKEVLPLGSETPLCVDLHVISATHCNLQERVATGEFREDLYYRLNGLTLTLPALRERPDRAMLIRGVLAAESDGEPVCMSEATFAALHDYSWPGNIRQLRNVLRTAVALSEDGVIRLENLPSEIARLPPKEQAQGIDAPSLVRQEDVLSNSEKEALLRVLNQHRWHITNTSVYLGLSRNTLYRKMKKHGIKAPTYV